MTEEDRLFKELENGNDNAFGQLVELYYPDIFRYCMWHTKDRFFAEDAAQETFLKAIRYFDSYTHKGKFRPFLYRIAANACIDMKRKRWADEALPEEIQSTEKGYVQAEAREDFRILMAGLSEEERELLILKYGQELTVKEIGQILGIPMRTVQSRIRKILKKLKEKKGG